ncbi:MAG: hypothetical protein WC712_10800 [Candidatus Brocadiia bacterium]
MNKAQGTVLAIGYAFFLLTLFFMPWGNFNILIGQWDGARLVAPLWGGPVYFSAGGSHYSMKDIDYKPMLFVWLGLVVLTVVLMVVLRTKKPASKEENK